MDISNTTQITICSPSKSFRDAIQSQFPHIYIINDLHQTFDVVYTDPDMTTEIVQWLVNKHCTFSIPRV